MITFNKQEVKDLDRLLKYLFIKQNKYPILEDPSNIELDKISVNWKELQQNLSFNDLKLNMYLQIFRNRNLNIDKMFIKMDHSIDKIWLMDLGIEFYYLGGFRRERKQQIIKRKFETASIIFGIIASLGVLLSIYLNLIDTRSVEKRIDRIEIKLNSSAFN